MAESDKRVYVKLSRELLDKAIDYISNFRDHEDQIPSIAGFCRISGVTRKSTYLWLEDPDGNPLREEWVELHDQLLCEQERTLLNKGLSKEFDSSLTKMILTKHGYAEKVDHDVTSGGKPVNNWTVNPVTTNKDG